MGEEFASAFPPPGPGSAAPRYGWCAWHPGTPGAAECAACHTPICPRCATPILEEGAPPGTVACPPCAPSYKTLPSVPFERPDRGFWEGLTATIAAVFARPGELFTCFPRSGAGSAILFGYLTMLPAALLGATCAAISLESTLRIVEQFQAELAPHWPGTQPMPRVTRDLLMKITVGEPVGSFVLMPLSTFLYAIVYHLLALVCGARGGFGTTFRILCYLAPIAWLGAVPCVGPLVAPIWRAVVVWVAFRRAHGLGPGGATLVALVPVLGPCCCAGSAVVAALFLLPLAFAGSRFPGSGR
ncbi:MAG: YIP1 family protein [Planctomycetales bacterium]|nr:YIP1 family protein [Planctomycetales bacterium]